MKKTLVALAALAATGAYAQVTISGYFGGSYDNVTITNPAAITHWKQVGKSYF